MKKVIFSVLVILSAGIVSSFTIKNDTAAAKHDTSARKEFGTADARKEFGTADAKQTPRHTNYDAKKEFGTAD